jgi:signal transduction histidine kinase
VIDRRKPLDLGEIASDLVELYEPLADEGGRSLLARTAPSPVIADRELVSRAIANLIDNALKYGGPEIVVATRQTGSWAELTVADNGPGIARSDRVRAVERFTRLDNARTMPGAGLGLAMVSAVAQLHGGDLELFGEDGGLVARFRLRLG